jgi:transcription elongation factor Elf1
MAGQLERTTHVGVAKCSRCGMRWEADISAPWQRPEGLVEWVVVRPHLHGNTQRSTCRPKGFARAVRATASATF